MSSSSSSLGMSDIRKALRNGECVCLAASAESFYDAVANEGSCPCGRLANEFASSIKSWDRKAGNEWKKLKGKLGIGGRRRRRRALLLAAAANEQAAAPFPLVLSSSTPSSSSSSSSASSRRLLQLGGIRLPPAPAKPQDLLPPVPKKPEDLLPPPAKPLKKKIGDLIDPGNLLPTEGRPLDQLLGIASGKACLACPPITPEAILDQLPPEGRERIGEVIEFIADTATGAGEGAASIGQAASDGVSDLGEQVGEEFDTFYGDYVAPAVEAYIEGWVACASGVQDLGKAAAQGKATGMGAYSAGQTCASAYAGLGAMSTFVEQVEDCDADRKDELAKLYRKHPKASPGDEFGVQEYAELGGSIAASVATENPAALIAWLRDQAVKQSVAIGMSGGPAACAVSQNLAAFTEALFRKFVECVDLSRPCSPELKFAGYTASAGVLEIKCEVDLGKTPVVGDAAVKASGSKDGRIDSLPHYLPWVEVRDGKGGGRGEEGDECAKSASLLKCPPENQLDKEKEIINDAYCGHLPGRKPGAPCMFVAFGDEIPTKQRVNEALASAGGAITGDGADKAGEVADAVKNMIKDLAKDVKASAKSLPRAVKAKASTFGKDFAAAVDAQASALLEKVASNILSGKRPTEALEVAEFKGMRVVAGTVSVQCSLFGQVFPGRVVPYVALDTRRGF